MPVYRQLSGGGTFRTGLWGNRLVAKRQGEHEARNLSGEGGSVETQDTPPLSSQIH